VARDLAAAQALLREAAEQGHAPAQYALRCAPLLRRTLREAEMRRRCSSALFLKLRVDCGSLTVLLVAVPSMHHSMPPYPAPPPPSPPSRAGAAWPTSRGKGLTRPRVGARARRCTGLAAPPPKATPGRSCCSEPRATAACPASRARTGPAPWAGSAPPPSR
jgi:hypothetical protein